MQKTLYFIIVKPIFFTMGSSSELGITNEILGLYFPIYFNKHPIETIIQPKNA